MTTTRLARAASFRLVVSLGLAAALLGMPKALQAGSCGGPNQACCGGGTAPCGPGLGCDPLAQVCVGCGDAWQQCCTGDVCTGPVVGTATADPSLTCHGGRCVPAGATCDPLACFYQSLACPDTQRAKCIPSRNTCMCVRPCNSDGDCASSELCQDGTCTEAARCTNDADCPVAGQFCGERGYCVLSSPCRKNTDCRAGDACFHGTCKPCVAAGAACPGCRSNADCSDGNPCNGEENCDGLVCHPGAPASCDDGDPLTLDFCRRNAVSGAQCEHWIWGGRNRCTPVYVRRAKLRIPTKSGKDGLRFTWSGVVAANVSSEAPFNLPNASVRVVLVDGKGRPLIDQTILPDKAAWSRSGKAAWTYKKAGLVNRISIGEPARGQAGRTFEVEGTLPAGFAATEDLKPVGALVLEWPGDGRAPSPVAAPCFTTPMPLCSLQPSGSDYVWICGSRGR